jgi:acyl-CoA synthetase (AMP-forming)/AMP-acid ligase II/1-acyl-sn-glycerol-3-phosphate acyltransferase/acyl carrier protein
MLQGAQSYAIFSIIAARIIIMKKWHMTVPPAALGMSIGLLLAGATANLPAMLQFYWLAISLIITGIAGGLFLIPITSFLQLRPDAKNKGRVIATANFSSFIGILLSGSIFSILTALISPASIMACLGVFTLCATVLFQLAISTQLKHTSSLILRAVKFILSLRYKIKVDGLENISTNNNKGIVFLPNHPALIDPAVCLSILYPKFRPRPLVDKEQGNKPFVKWLVNHIQPIFIPDLSQNGKNKVTSVKQALNEVIDSLDSGKNIILYPSGRLYRSSLEDLAGNSGVEYILKNIPEVNIALIRTTGLWGSSFSYADGQAPSLFRHFKKYLSAIIINGFFFTPKRKVHIEIIQGNSLKSQPDRLSINKQLEIFYNEKKQPNLRVPYFWWQGSTPENIPEPVKKVFSGKAGNISKTTKDLVLEKLKELTGYSDIKETDRLAHDLAIDSLAMMEFAGWLESEFGVLLDDMTSLLTVNDSLLAASGQIPEKKQTILKPVSDKWQKGRKKKLTFPREKTITSAFLNMASQRPREIIFADQTSGTRTYQEIITAIFVLKPIFEKIDNERVGIMMPASASSGILFMAALFAGKTPVLLNWTVGTGNMKHCLETTNLSHIITASPLLKKLSDQGIDLSIIDAQWLFIDILAKEIPLYDKLKAAAKAALIPSSLKSSKIPETAAILFTSGSESKPKAVPLTHENIMANMKDFSSILSVNEEDRLLGMLPPFHSLGLVGTIILPLCLGLKTVYHSNPTESGILARIVDHYKVSILIGTPTFLDGIANSADKEQLKSLKLLFTGAEKCPDHVYQTFKSICPEAVLCEGYGITECSPLVSINHIKNPKQGTIGKVLPSMEYLIIDQETQERVDQGERGILIIRGPNIFSGYFNGDSGKGFCEFEGKSWYNTGDFVKEDSEKNLIFCGRKKRFIKLGGEMISLPAIESVLQKHFPASNGNGPTLAVEATPEDEHPEIVLFTTIEVDREAANRSIRNNGLSALHNIRRLENIESIPVLGTGKTDYKQLKERLTTLGF